MLYVRQQSASSHPRFLPFLTQHYPTLTLFTGLLLIRGKTRPLTTCCFQIASSFSRQPILQQENRSPCSTWPSLTAATRQNKTVLSQIFSALFRSKSEEIAVRPQGRDRYLTSASVESRIGPHTDSQNVRCWPQLLLSISPRGAV